MKKATLTLLMSVAFSYLYHAKSKDMVNIPEIELIRHPETGEIVPEEWRDVVGYEGLYAASNYARIISFHRDPNGILLRPRKMDGNYLGVILSKGDSEKHKRIHILTFNAFYGEDPTPNMVIDHKDNNKDNNHLLNLQRISKRKNCTKDRGVKMSKYPGVYKGARGYWNALTYYDGKCRNLGCSKSEEEAGRMYQEGMKKLGIEL